MYRIGFAIVLLLATACSDGRKESTTGGETSEKLRGVPGNFPEAALPFQITDSALQQWRDTAAIRSPEFAALVPDSLVRSLFGSDSRVRYTAIATMEAPRNVQYYVVKGSAGSKQAALLMAYSDGNFGGVLPLLVPDKDPDTRQVSSVARNSEIARTVTLSLPGQGPAEEREVFDYSPQERRFRNLVVSAVADGSEAVINPIDTFPRTRKFTGDYLKDKRNIVSIRDGRAPNELRMFIHVESGEGAEACKGELRGDLVLISPTAAVFRKNGDPCVMNFRFTGNSVTVAEEQGCGSHRDLTCEFNGDFPLKKDAKPKPSARKKK